LLSRSINDGSKYLYQEGIQEGCTSNTKGFIETRNKVLIQSVSNKTKKGMKFMAYTSLSELGCWRLCFIRTSDCGLDKFDNYLQATQIHPELQKFIWKKWDTIPYAKIRHTRHKTMKLKIEKNKSHKHGIYSGFNKHGSLPCQLTTEDIRSEIVDRGISFNTIDTGYPISKSRHTRYDYMRTNYTVDLSKPVYSYTFDFEYNTRKKGKMNTLTHGTANIYYLDCSKTKKKDVNITFVVCEYKVRFVVQSQETPPETRRGFYIMNVLETGPLFIPITEYGIAEKYIHLDEYPETNEYILKPLEYTDQALEFTSRDGEKIYEDVGLTNYVSLAINMDANEIPFPCNRLYDEGDYDER